MENGKTTEVPVFHDSGLGSLGSESDSSPVTQTILGPLGAAAPSETKQTELISRSAGKMFRVVYLGESVLDRRYTQPMLPWIMAEVRRRQERRSIVLEVLSHRLRALIFPAECDSGSATETATPLFEHRLQSLSRFARTHQDPKCFAYLTRANLEAPFTCHVFQANEEGLVPELFTAIREATRAAVRDQQSHNGSNEGKSVDVVGELEHAFLSGRLFEVMYIGKAKVKDKKGPPTIIDEAVEMFLAQEQKRRQEHQVQQHKEQAAVEVSRRRNESCSSSSSLPSNVPGSVVIKENDLARQNQANNDRHSHRSTESCLSTSYASNSSSSAENITNGNNSGGEQFDFSSETEPSDEFVGSEQLRLVHGSRLEKEGQQQGEKGEEVKSGEQTLEVLAPPNVDSNRNKTTTAEDTHSVSSVEEELRLTGASTTSSCNSTCSRTPLSNSNRVLLIQVGQYEVCLISPDKKTVILERKFKDISFCFQGIKHPEHFGFNTRDPASGNFVCYVFRCADKPVVEEIMQALQQAFHSAFQQSVRNHVVCELCPMHQLHKLCQEIEGLPPTRVYEILQRRVDQLNEKDYNQIMTGFKAEGLATDQEKCEVMMIMLRHVCEAKQKEHTHISDTNKPSTAKYEFNLMDKSKPSKFDNFKSKAKKSLANSFENLIRGKTKREEAKESFRERSWTTESDASYTRSFDSAYTPGSSPSGSPCTSPLAKERPDHLPTIVGTSAPTDRLDAAAVADARRDFTRKRSATIGALPDVTQLQMSPGRGGAGGGGGGLPQPPPSTVDVSHALSPSRYHHDGGTGASSVGACSPRRTMYEQVASPGGDRANDTLGIPPPNGGGGGAVVVNGVVAGGGDQSRSPTPSLAGDQAPPVTPQRKMSWRLGILNRVVTPARCPDASNIPEGAEGSEVGAAGDGSPLPRRRLTSQSLRALWRKAILETLLLIRMEKENISLQARQDAAEIKRIKLDYQEIIPCLKDVTKVWEEMLLNPGRPQAKLDFQAVHDAVRAGVPRHQRGDIWQLLVEQHRHHHQGSRLSGPPPEDTVRYEDLLKQLTTQQHAILIDLGRTFPGHPYFARQLGAGQLSLFNLLKAYSLVDKEVGYCQGLSFVAGVLLMHMREELAFDTLKYLMFRLGFRRQYRPDMVALQIQMYQLSRLLHDMYRDLYDHLERHDIAPTLYAAPWFLTIFASQFPLGFVARVFDLIFLQGVEVVFKVALILLGDHRELIKQCNSFESIVEFLKTTLPGMSIIQMERVINQVFQLDISKQLQAYEVEYHVLQEEMVTSPERSDADVIAKLEAANHSLKRQNLELLEQLQTGHSNQHSLEIQINNLQANQNKLRAHIRTLELERGALLQTVAKLRALVPADLLEARQVSLPALYPDVTFNTSPVHAAGLGRLLADPPQAVATGGNNRSRAATASSLSDLDSEVASLTAGAPRNGPTLKSPTFWPPYGTQDGRPVSSSN